ncbi:hypothetical protein YC2023_100868 [Brassica napus]
MSSKSRRKIPTNPISSKFRRKLPTEFRRLSFFGFGRKFVSIPSQISDDLGVRRNLRRNSVCFLVVRNLERSRVLKHILLHFLSLTNVNPSILIFFEIKSFNAGQITAESFSLVHKHENHQFQRGLSQFHLVYVITKLGMLFVYNLETASVNLQKSDKSTPNFLRLLKLSELEGFMPVGQVLLAKNLQQYLLLVVQCA